jgi:abscisic-aldehyde oxidase
VDDIPSPMNCLYGAFIYSTKPFAKVKSIKFKSKSLPFGVAALICFKDIPKDGENIGSKSIFGAEPLFADEMTRYAGERIALVVICNISFYFFLFFLIYC